MTSTVFVSKIVCVGARTVWTNALAPVWLIVVVGRPSGPPPLRRTPRRASLSAISPLFERRILAAEALFDADDVVLADWEEEVGTLAIGLAVSAPPLGSVVHRGVIVDVNVVVVAE